MSSLEVVGKRVIKERRGLGGLEGEEGSMLKVEVF